MEKKKTLIYVSPQVNVTRVRLEQGIALVKVSCTAYLGGGWIEEPTPVGSDTDTEGGDIVLFY